MVSPVFKELLTVWKFRTRVWQPF